MQQSKADIPGVDGRRGGSGPTDEVTMAGHLTRVVQQIADFSETEFDDAVQRVTQFIEPLMVTVIGVVIGGVAIALLLPIFTVAASWAGAEAAYAAEGIGFS